MGLHNRTYWRDEGSGGGGYQGGGGGLMVGMPKPSQAVKVLLIANFVMFVIQLLGREPVNYGLAVYPQFWWQPWRYVTFQFLHGGIFHILLNMLGLYMLGTPLEQRLGTREFVKFYLSCGVAAGIAYVIIGQIHGGVSGVPLVGASGGVFGILLAAAVFFPHFRLIFFLFPVPIRFACVLIAFIMLARFASALGGDGFSGEVWSDIAHLGGALMGAFWIWVLPHLRGSVQETRAKIGKGAWERKLKRQADEQAEVDRILDKIHTKGITSLTHREKKILKDATNRQQQDENRINRL